MWDDNLCEKYDTPEHLAGFYMKIKMRTTVQVSKDKWENKWVRIYNIYLHPQDSDMRTRVWMRLKKEIKEAREAGEAVLIGGDFNGVLLKELRNTILRNRDQEFKGKVEGNNLNWIQTDDAEYTWKKSRRGDSMTGRIDGWLSTEENPEGMETEVIKVPRTWSDHHMVKISINTKCIGAPLLTFDGEAGGIEDRMSRKKYTPTEKEMVTEALRELKWTAYDANSKLRNREEIKDTFTTSEEISDQMLEGIETLRNIMKEAQ
jgi:hypothetical protein